MDDDDSVPIRAAFARQRRRLFAACLVTVLAVAALWVGGFPGLHTTIGIVVWCLALLAMAAFLVANSACPACRDSIAQPFFVRFCPHCGVRLL